MIVTVEKIVHQGYGLARTDEGVVFIEGVMPGEKVRIKSVEQRKKTRFAKEFDIIESSPARVKPFCSYFSECGGCQWQFAPYDIQLEWKKQILTETLARIYGEALEPEKIIAGEETGYRRRMRFHVHSGTAGFYRRGTKEITSISQCPVFCQQGNELFSIFVDELQRCSSEFCRKMKSVEIRVTSDGKDFGFLFITPTGNGSKAFVGEIVQQKNEINAWVSLSKNELPGKGFRTIAGKDYLQDTGFVVSPLSFYQPNLNLALRVYGEVAAVINSSGVQKVVDIYCGIGLLEIMLHEDIEVLGVEINKYAVEDARINVFLNEKKAEFISMDASELTTIEEAELVAVNPPRAGLHRNLIQALSKSKDIRAIVYLSCDPATLARDMKMLKQGGYVVKNLWLADYYPHTFHFESVAFLERSQLPSV